MPCPRTVLCTDMGSPDRAPGKRCGPREAGLWGKVLGPGFDLCDSLGKHQALGERVRA